MKKIYKFLFFIVDGMFPKIHQKYLNRLTSTQKTVIGIKYWLTAQLLE